MTPSPAPKISVPFCPEKLASLGMLLDQMEQHAFPWSARQYRKAAREAALVIETHCMRGELRAACQRSNALQDLLENRLYEKAAADSTMRWAMRYSAQSGKFEIAIPAMGA